MRNSAWTIYCRSVSSLRRVYAAPEVECTCIAGHSRESKITIASASVPAAVPSSMAATVSSSMAATASSYMAASASSYMAATESSYMVAAMRPMPTVTTRAWVAPVHQAMLRVVVTPVPQAMPVGRVRRKATVLDRMWEEKRAADCHVVRCGVL